MADRFSNQFFNVDGQNNIQNLNNDIIEGLRMKETEFHEKIRREQQLLAFVTKVSLFLQLKTQHEGRGREIFQRLVEQHGMEIAPTDLISRESDIIECGRLLDEAKRLKLTFSALEKIKLIKKLWDDAIGAERFCQSCMASVAGAVNKAISFVNKNFKKMTDCYKALENAINALKRSAIFSRVYHDVNHSAYRDEETVVNDARVTLNRNEASHIDWFNGDATRFENRTLRDIEDHYETLKRQRIIVEDAERNEERRQREDARERMAAAAALAEERRRRAMAVGHYDFGVKRSTKRSKKSSKKVKSPKKRSVRRK